MFLLLLRSYTTFSSSSACEGAGETAYSRLPIPPKPRHEYLVKCLHPNPLTIMYRYAFSKVNVRTIGNHGHMSVNTYTVPFFQLLKYRNTQTHACSHTHTHTMTPASLVRTRNECVECVLFTIWKAVGSEEQNLRHSSMKRLR